MDVDKVLRVFKSKIRGFMKNMKNFLVNFGRYKLKMLNDAQFTVIYIENQDSKQVPSSLHTNQRSDRRSSEK